MPSIKQIYDYSPKMLDDITAGLTEKAKRDITERIINAFIRAGLPVKVKQITPESGDTYFRVMCYVRKSIESVLINTRSEPGKKGIFNGLNIQIRIADRSMFERLDNLPENVRNTIVCATECVSCTPKCEGKKYVFVYKGIKYVKCQYLCANFRFWVKSDADADGILSIIENEISLKKK